MPIFIKTEDFENLPSYAIVEIQGNLESRTEKPLNCEFIGDLHYRKEKSGYSPILVIGHQMFLGRLQKLDKPFALLEKQKNIENDVTSYGVKALITRKIIFDNGPEQ